MRPGCRLTDAARPATVRPKTAAQGAPQLGGNMWRVKPLDAILATAEKKSLHRSLGPVQLTMLGIGAVIGTGIFVLTATAAQKAGPGMMFSFIIAGAVCAVAALCYSELSSMAPVAGSAYTYSYAVLGELVAVGWSGYITGLLHSVLHISIPVALAAGPSGGGLFNLPAVLITAAVTGL